MRHAGTFFRFFSGAAEYAKLALAKMPENADEHAARERKQHRAVVIAGTIGAACGLVLGIVGMVAMLAHPPSEPMRSDDLGITLLEPFIMVALGILSGAGWVCAFLPNSFFQSSAGVRWMRLLGTKRVGVARLTSLLIGVTGIGACVGLLICIETGHV